MNAPGTAPAAPAPSPPAPQAPPTAPATPAPPPAQPGTPEGTPSPEPSWDPQTRAYIESLRRESASHRTQNKELQAKLDAQQRGIAAALGIKVDGQVSDPEVLQREIGTLKTTNRNLSIDNALVSEAAKQKVMIAPLRAFLRDQGHYDQLDPAQSDFTTKLHAAVKTIAEEYPYIKEPNGQAPAQPPTTSGVPAGGGQPPSTQWTMDDLNRARREGREADVAKALKEGKLNGILKRQG